jgi:HSP20 family protein
MFDFEHPFGELQREMERYLQHVARGRRPVAVFSRRTWQPAVDIYETETEVVALIDLSGVSEDAIDLVVGRNSLTVQGERSETEQGAPRTYSCMEIPFGPFERTAQFASPVDPEGVAASYSAGFLRVVMPKARIAHPRRVTVHEP